MSNLERRKKIHRQVLEYLAEHTTTNTHAHVKDVEEALGFTRSEIVDAFNTLEEKGFVDTSLATIGNPRASVTARGMDEIDRLQAPPLAPQIPMQIHNNFHSTANVQQGNHNTMNINHGLSADDVLKLVSQLRNHLSDLPAEKRDDAVEQIEELEMEFQNSTPKMSRVKAALMYLFQMALPATAFYADVVQIAQAHQIPLPGINF